MVFEIALCGTKAIFSADAIIIRLAISRSLCNIARILLFRKGFRTLANEYISSLQYTEDLGITYETEKV